MKKFGLVLLTVIVSQVAMAKDLVCMSYKLDKQMNGHQIKHNSGFELSTGSLKGFTLENIQNRAVQGSIVANLIFSNVTLKRKFQRTGYNEFTLQTSSNTGILTTYKLNIENLDGKEITFKAMTTEIESLDRVVISETIYGTCL